MDGNTWCGHARHSPRQSKILEKIHQEYYNKYSCVLFPPPFPEVDFEDDFYFYDTVLDIKYLANYQVTSALLYPLKRPKHDVGFTRSKQLGNAFSI